MTESIPDNGLQTTILLISDDYETGTVFGFSLQQQGYFPVTFHTSAAIQEHWSDQPPDLIIIDIHNFNTDGGALCRSLRGETAVPILLFLPRNDECLILDGYRAGADECLANPVSPAMFLAKIQAWLRRSQVVPAKMLENLQAGGLMLDPDHRQLTLISGKSLRLTNLESRLLYLLMRHPGRALETNYIVSRVWGSEAYGDAVLLKNVIYRLRRKIEVDPGEPVYILTEQGVGYKFQG